MLPKNVCEAMEAYGARCAARGGLRLVDMAADPGTWAERAALETAIRAALEESRRVGEHAGELCGLGQAARIADGWAARYPEDVFPPGSDHSIDARAAGHGRRVAQAIAADVRALAPAAGQIPAALHRLFEAAGNETDGEFTGERLDELREAVTLAAPFLVPGPGSSAPSATEPSELVPFGLGPEGGVGGRPVRRATPDHIQTVHATAEQVQAFNERPGWRWVIYFEAPGGARAQTLATLAPYPGIHCCQKHAEGLVCEHLGAELVAGIEKLRDEGATSSTAIGYALDRLDPSPSPVEGDGARGNVHKENDR